MKETRSMIASLWVVRILLLIMLASAFFVPYISHGYSMLTTNSDAISQQITIGLYTLLCPAMVTMVSLHCLLSNINKGNMFVRKNITYLTAVCVGVFLVGIISFFISLVSCFFSFITLAFLFSGVILLVLRNVFKRAVEIKEENDYTI